MFWNCLACQFHSFILFFFPGVNEKWTRIISVAKKKLDKNACYTKIIKTIFILFRFESQFVEYNFIFLSIQQKEQNTTMKTGRKKVPENFFFSLFFCSSVGKMLVVRMETFNWNKCRDSESCDRSNCVATHAPNIQPFQHTFTHWYWSRTTSSHPPMWIYEPLRINV